MGTTARGGGGGSGEDPNQTTTAYYSPLPPQPPPPDQYYILLPYYHPRRHRYLRHRRQGILCFTILILICLAFFFLWPSDPSLQIVRLQLNHVRLHTTPVISLDISIALTVKVRNTDFFSLRYNSLEVSIGYRGRTLGFVDSNGGFVKARGTSYVNATLVLNGFEVLHDVFYLLEDLARGWIPFDTVTEVRGDLGVLFLEIPIKAKVSCEVDVNTNNETILRQNCYPE